MQVKITGKIHEIPNNEYFTDYLSWVGRNSIEDIPEYLIPLNPPPVPRLQKDETAVDFVQSIDNATDYILYAAGACQRLRVEEEINRRSKLRWYSALADIYDDYKSLLANVPSLKNSSPKVRKASEIAEDVKRDKLKRTALAKEVMAGRRINKILDAFNGQWHVIDFLDFITKDLLVNSSQEFIDKLIQGIRWPIRELIALPYILMETSGSSHQYYLPNNLELVSEDN